MASQLSGTEGTGAKHAWVTSVNSDAEVSGAIVVQYSLSLVTKRADVPFIVLIDPSVSTWLKYLFFNCVIYYWKLKFSVPGLS